LKSLVHIDVEHRAFEGVEVEELTPQQIDDILRSTSEEMKTETTKPTLHDPEDKSIAELANKIYPNLNETLEAIALDSDQKEIFKVPISEVVDKLSSQTGIKYLILDGIITQRLLNGAKQAGIDCVIGHRVAKLASHDGASIFLRNP